MARATGGGVEYLGGGTSFTMTNCSVVQNQVESGGGGAGAQGPAGDTASMRGVVVSIFRVLAL